MPTRQNPLSQIERRFDFNMQRVTGLVELFDTIRRNPDQSYSMDILRSAVVLLHASLEDLLRGLLAWKLRDDPRPVLDRLQFPPLKEDSEPKRELRPRDMWAYKGKTVDEIMRQSIAQHLRQRSFNNGTQLTQALEHLSLDVEPHRVHFEKIEEAMKRRHKIVHDSDRAERDLKHHGKPTTLKKDQVAPWLETTKAFGAGVLAALRQAPEAEAEVEEEPQPKPRRPRPTPKRR